MKKTFAILSFLLLMIFTVDAQTEKVKFIEYGLPNGLHVILYQDHSTPNVMVSLMYHVGSKNEHPERTGFAHLFEHLMFEGSKHIDRGEYMKIVPASGGELNANTSFDRTYYFEMMPANQLELALWMEAERMLHAKIDTIGVNTQKGVVIEERKQTIDNNPYGTFIEELCIRLFTIHPYRTFLIGSPEHIRNSTFDDIYNFYKTYYVPNNCVLVIAGDFEEENAKAMVQKYFGDIPRGTFPINRPTIVEPPMTGEIRDIVYDKIQLPGVFTGYRSPAMGTKDSYAIDLLCSILSSGKSARLKTNLTDKGITMMAMALNFGLEHPGPVIVAAIANAGKTIEEVESALNAEIEKLHELIDEEEFQMAKAAKEYEFASGLTSLSAISQELANGYTYFKDAGRINKELENYNSITREDLRDAARKYLNKDSRVVLHYLPESQK
ncbi:MAG: insulinase family protein [Prevotellaceae bacterium]|jgi:predicted Zn-dependent peptidase|nr:insulinase family protein [Prevotellaceae bacterium]